MVGWYTDQRIYEKQVERMRSNEYFEKLVNHYKDKRVVQYFEDFIRFSNKKKSTILDCGCGIGFLSKSLENKGNVVIGMDINKHSLKFSKKENKLKNVVIGSVYNLPFKKDVFDSVYFIDVLEHLKNPELPIKEIWSVLKINRDLIIITPNGIYRKFGMIIGVEPDPTHVHEFDWKELCSFLNTFNFRISDYHVAGLPLLNKINFRFTRRLGNIFNDLLINFSSPSFWVICRKTVDSNE